MYVYVKKRYTVYSGKEESDNNLWFGSVSIQQT